MSSDITARAGTFVLPKRDDSKECKITLFAPSLDDSEFVAEIINCYL